MTIDLDRLLETARSIGFRAERRDALLVVELPDGLRLHFENWADGDAAIWFDGTPWHAHPPLALLVAPDSLRQLSCDEVLEAVGRAELLVVELWEHGVLADRWLEHRDGADPGLRHTQPGEEFRIRVAGATGE